MHGPHCWCKPTLFKLCPECMGQESDCFLCEGQGLIEFDASELFLCDYDEVVFVSHQLDWPDN